ncbi:ninja-family protein 3-like [Amaranthus tricolor]|uniref:ninja-family protein 3-like n=1 Tax=Amaranthus tricolor TaxID=29722 RepID=UPI002585301F|nr:ninja-family protein 3-like [Amaranthus tricolor]
MTEQQEDIEISTESNTIIDEDGLELSLSLRPSGYSSFNDLKNLPETYASPASNGQIFSERDAQSLRRHEANKLKRGLKRKDSVENDVVAIQEEDFVQRSRKVQNLGLQQAALPSVGRNAGSLNGGFRPYKGQNGKISPCIEGKDGNTSVSSGSSSGISDNHQIISGAGGNSSDTGSHSSHPHSQLPSPSAPSSSTTSQLRLNSSQLDLQPNTSKPNRSKSQVCSSSSNKIELNSVSKQPCKSLDGATSLNTTPQSTVPKETKPEIGKPPKPNGLMGQQKAVFSQMPCVSATGNGPNGKTITGFLYKYTNTEVGIVCVCHGASFSPASFVEHAGGVDVEYPLRHIKVVSFPLS